MTTDLEMVERHLLAGDTLRASAVLRYLFDAQPTLSMARIVIRHLERFATGGGRSCRVWLLRSFTVEPIFPLLRAAMLLEGLDLQVRAGDFNAYVQEIVNPRSALYEFDPEVVILAVQTRDLLPALWDLAAGAESYDPSIHVGRAIEHLRAWLSTLRTHSSANIVIFDFAQPLRASNGALDAQSSQGQSASIELLNRQLRDLAATMTGVYILGFDALVARLGRERFYDEKKWLTMRMPIAAQNLWPLARECLRVLLPITGTVRKAVVVDLDNTLWGGVIGEDGPEGIKLGIDYPGAAYLELQKVLLNFHRRGIILAVASKNNPADAMEILEKHPSMLLRPKHFAAMQLNWSAKSQSLRAIAQELKIGTDALVFIDDNPAEREEVRQELPEVLVVEMPKDPMDYAATVRDLPSMERVRIVTEDRDRGRQYAEQRERSSLKAAHQGGLEDYLHSLGMQVRISGLSKSTLARVSQLTQKTNQFNLTTRRYDEASLAAMMQDPNWHIYSCSVLDRFGDNGLVGVAIAHGDGQAWEIDTLLLSCRVIGRTVETAMLWHLVSECCSAGKHVLRGWFLPTSKNQPAADFYRLHGFRRIEDRNGATLWEFNTASGKVEWPSWLTSSPGNAAA